MNLRVKQKIPLKIKRMGINGEGIGFYKRTLVFVPGALKGEEIFCQITSVKHNFVQARLLTINKKSKFRVRPACPIYEECGGCQIMHLRYDKQLDFKKDLLKQALKNLSLKVMRPMTFERQLEWNTLSIIAPSYNFRRENLAVLLERDFSKSRVIIGRY